MSDHLATLLEKFGQEIGENPSSINFFLDGKLLEASETIGRLNIGVSSIIEAEQNYWEKSKTIRVKLQTKDRRKVKTMEVVFNQKFGAMFDSYCKMMKLDLKNLKFYFEGEMLMEDSTPEEMRFEDEECIDVVC